MVHDSFISCMTTGQHWRFKGSSPQTCIFWGGEGLRRGFPIKPCIQTYVKPRAHEEVAFISTPGIIRQ